MASAGASAPSSVAASPSLRPSHSSIDSSSSACAETASGFSRTHLDAMNSSSPSGHNVSDDVDGADDDDALLLALPTDRDSVQDDIARVKETIQRVEEGTADDFVLGCELLLASKQHQVTRAYANFERFKHTALQLYEYECEQAKARYRARCEQLQQDMSDEIEREIQRLQNARDGVSVMDRRRLTRTSGRAAEPKTKGKTKGRGLSGAEEAHRFHHDDKKRLEALLSKTPVFAPLQQRLDADAAASDLNAIARAVQHRSGASRSRVLDKRRRVAFARLSGSAATDSDDSVSDAGSGSADCSDSDAAAGTRDPVRPRGGRRLAYNPAMLQEGDRVVVYRRARRDAEEEDEGTRVATDGDEESKRANDDAADDKRVLSGVITASTAALVFLLCANGEFETISVRDWKDGRVRVHALDKRVKR